MLTKPYAHRSIIYHDGCRIYGLSVFSEGVWNQSERKMLQMIDFLLSPAPPPKLGSSPEFIISSSMFISMFTEHTSLCSVVEIAFWVS